MQMILQKGFRLDIVWHDVILRSFLPINSSVFFVRFLQMFAILEIVSINLTNFQLSVLVETLSFEIRK
jgi:hypothetical protein